MEHQQYKNATAWMVRRDGCIFPIVQHIYGNVMEIEETLFAAAWLYGHTGWEQTRQDIVDFTVAWITHLERETDSDMGLAGYCRKVTLDLNEEFMRVRFGGLYHTEPGNRKLYFRISSENFNWSEVIMGFLNQTQLDYEEFYVVIDEESAEVNPAILKQSRFLRRVSGDE